MLVLWKKTRNEENNMAYSEAQKRASMKWHKKHLTQIKFNLNNETDSDIIEWLEAKDNRQGYIKSLIRADIAKNKCYYR